MVNLLKKEVPAELEKIRCKFNFRDMSLGLFLLLFVLLSGGAYLSFASSRPLKADRRFGEATPNQPSNFYWEVAWDVSSDDLWTTEDELFASETSQVEEKAVISSEEDKNSSPQEKKKKSQKKKKSPLKQEVPLQQTSPFHPHEEVVVTATMTRKAVKDCSASVSVITSQAVEAIPASNALNLLGQFPGVFVRRTGDFGRADIDIRGLGNRGRRIAVLVNGRPEKMGLFGCVISHAFPLDNVERIELVRGPASVLYGSEALGGVVNIITHQPEAGWETQLNGSYGSFNTQQLNLRHGAGFAKWGYYLTFDQRLSDGHRPNSQYKGRTFTGNIFIKFSPKTRLIFHSKYFAAKKHEPGPIDFPLENFWNDYQRGAFDLSWQRADEQREYLLMIYRNQGHHRFSDGWHSRDYVDGALLRLTHRWGNHEITTGTEWRRLAGKSYHWPQGKWHKSEAALFLQDEYIFRQRLILSAGLRLHRDSLAGLELCPRWGLVWQVGRGVILRSTISEGFRAPQLNELFMFPPANPDLQPERVWNYELGGEFDWGSKTRFSWAVFQMKGSNLIEVGRNPTPPPAFLFQNKGEFVFSGVELSWQQQLNPSLFSRIDYSFLDPGRLTRGRPRHKLDVLLAYRRNKIKAFVTGQYVAGYYAGDNQSQPLPNYFCLNARFFWTISHHVEALVEVRNILDADYQIFVDLPGIGTGPYPMPGRNFQIGLRLKQ
ncbi:MAG: hypothetical protein DRJ11_04440 [Candidatus Aminicenantes bacterium]|nr:MAG: hypothetical protein DRJ11_04440 [Candidatus Aminicenantes bacterium]